LECEDELEELWLAQQHMGLRERWGAALRSVVFSRPSKRIVIFIDEIDAVRSLPFSADDLFAAICECDNRRAQGPELGRLTFCLLGVATPTDRIRGSRATPFNVGRRIDLDVFSEAEAASLIDGLGRAEPMAQALLQRILHWTGGHPYLTQRLCRAVAEDVSITGTAGGDRVCEELFLSPQGRERDDNLLFVRARLLGSGGGHLSVGRVTNLLHMYAQVLHGQQVPDDETNPLVNALRLSGIVQGVNGYLHVRNPIYEQVFDREWVEVNLAERQKPV
jgi:hypothetical protein